MLMGKVIPRALPLLVCALLLCAPQAFAQTKSPDLANTVWNGRSGNFSFILSVTQAKPGQRFLAAVLKGWGDGPLDLRGEYSQDADEPHLQLRGSYEGNKVSLDVKLNQGDVEQRPSLEGEFSVGSKVIPVSAECTRQCPDFTFTESPAEAAAAEAARAKLIGEWQDESGAIGYKEYWSIKLVGLAWSISGKFVKGDEVVGTFHGEEISFDPKKGVFRFDQLFDQKPDEAWMISNEIEATVQGDTLKFKVRGAEGILTRAPAAKE
jgi:hypothetical protein